MLPHFPPLRRRTQTLEGSQVLLKVRAGVRLLQATCVLNQYRYLESVCPHSNWQDYMVRSEPSHSNQSDIVKVGDLQHYKSNRSFFSRWQETAKTRDCFIKISLYYQTSNIQHFQSTWQMAALHVNWVSAKNISTTPEGKHLQPKLFPSPSSTACIGRDGLI